MSRYDDEDAGAAPKKRRFRLMHFTMLMLAMVMVSKITEVATATKELVSIRNAQAASDEPEEKADAKEAESDVAAEEETSAAEGEKAAEAKEDAADADESKEEKAVEEAKDEGGHGEGEGEEGKPAVEKTLGTGKHTVEEIEALKAQQGGSAYTQTEVDLLQNLTKRRNELDEREKELEMKSKVLDASELRITNKVNEMKTLQAELTKVVAQYKQQQDGEIKSLVKIYENMKPKDAAAIFNEMDMPILLEVIDKMSERKVAPILAGMDPRRARDVTQELAEMRRGRAALNAAASDATN